MDNVDNVDNVPKISCLTVTKDRLVLLKEAVRCFTGQTYPNKELVIVTDGKSWYKDAVQRYLDTLGRSDITLKRVEEENVTLGRLRNIAMETAAGPLLCQWDDDDCYHPQRLEAQFNHLNAENAHACFLSDQLHYFPAEREMYWVDWTRASEQPRHHLIPGTLLMVKDPRFRYPETGPLSRKGEDDAIIDRMVGNVKLTGLYGAGYLYVYRYHGANAFSRRHHIALATRWAASRDRVMEKLDNLFAALDYYHLPMPYVIKSADGETAVFDRMNR